MKEISAAPSGDLRRLRAVISVDVAGSSAPMRVDEEGTIARTRSPFTELVTPAINGTQGRAIKLLGGALHAEPTSPLDPVDAAPTARQSAPGARPPNDGLSHPLLAHGEIMDGHRDSAPILATVFAALEDSVKARACAEAITAAARTSPVAGCVSKLPCRDPKKAARGGERLVRGGLPA